MPDALPPDLPQSVRDLAELVGLPATLSLVEQLGGIRLYVPSVFGSDHPVARAVGPEKAELISATYAGDTLTLPRCPKLIRAARDRKIREDRAAGMTENNLARKYGLTNRRIQYILAAPAPSDVGQGDLFAPRPR